MATNLPQGTVDAVIEALADGDKERAILLCHRAGGDDLEAAWSGVQQMLADLGSGGDEAPRRAAADPSFRNVKYYLTADAATRRKAILRSAVLSILLLGVAAYVLVDHSTKLLAALRSLSWPSTEATVTKVRLTSTRRLEQQREVDTYYMHFAFRYAVEGREYTGSRARVQYYKALGDKPFQAGDRFEIAYNPEDPAETAYDRQIYRRVFAIAVGLVLLGLGALIAAVERSRTANLRRLKQLDQESASPT